MVRLPAVNPGRVQEGRCEAGRAGGVGEVQWDPGVRWRQCSAEGCGLGEAWGAQAPGGGEVSDALLCVTLWYMYGPRPTPR